MQTHSKMDNQAIFNKFLQYFLQVNMHYVRLYIISFVDYFGQLIKTKDDDIDTFVRDTHTPNSAREAESRIIIGSIVFTHIKDFRIELKYSNMFNTLTDKANPNEIDMDQVNILTLNRN